MAQSRNHQPCPGSGTAAFHYRAAELYCEDAALEELAELFGTPLYVYSQAAMAERYRALRAAFGDAAHICYAVKANPNLSVLRTFAGFGAGFDLVSGGELRRLQAAGVPTAGAVFAGVAKQPWEIAAALDAGILFFNLESPHELEQLATAGRQRGVRVPVALRLNPDVDAGTHAYIRTGDRAAKFGVDLATAATLVERIAREPHLQLCGYHVHLGSQLRTEGPYLQALDRVAAFLDGAAVRREGVSWYDLGGGFGIGYGTEATFDAAALARAILPRLQALSLRPVLEPGRFLIGDAGVLVTTVLGTKTTSGRRFLLVDAAMNDLLRPALYQAEHPMAPLHEDGREQAVVDVVGPVCETGDFLARQRRLPVLEAGERLAVLGSGAYGAAMASNYNSRPRPAEVLVHGAQVLLVRRREALDDLWSCEVES
jgi:diaminopimelate decarboxylase